MPRCVERTARLCALFLGLVTIGGLSCDASFVARPHGSDDGGPQLDEVEPDSSAGGETGSGGLEPDEPSPGDVAALASDDFENGAFEGWYAGKGWEWPLWAHAGAVEVATGGDARSGTRHACFGKGEVEGVIFRKVYLVGATDVTLSFAYKATGLGANDSLNVIIRDDPRHEVDVVVGSLEGDEPSYELVEFDLSSYGMVRNFYVWFRGVIGTQEGRICIDDVEVHGKRLPRTMPELAVPEPGAAWDWTISGDVRSFNGVMFYDIDGFDNSANTVSELQNAGALVACYLDVGTAENWRPDYDDFPDVVRGNDVSTGGGGWSGQDWLDLRRLDLLLPLMLRRLDMCEEKGFDLTQFDDLWSWQVPSGFNLAALDSVDFTVLLMSDSRSRGMASGYENNTGVWDDTPNCGDAVLSEEHLEGMTTVEAMAEYTDILLLEDSACFYCPTVARPIYNAGKPVFAVEYTDTDCGDDPDNYCDEYREIGIRAIRKDRLLHANRNGARYDCGAP